MNAYIALLRGINVTGRNKVPMSELKELAAGLGWTDVATYIQSGNVVFRARGAPAKLEDALEKAIAKHFELAIPVIVRAAKDWPGYVAGNPFADACKTAPNRVMLGLSKSTPLEGAAGALRERATAGEQVKLVGDALWINFPEGVARSKLTPALLDRLVGSPVTMRNWNTVQKLAEMADV